MPPPRSQLSKQTARLPLLLQSRAKPQSPLPQLRTRTTPRLSMSTSPLSLPRRPTSEERRSLHEPLEMTLSGTTSEARSSSPAQVVTSTTPLPRPPTRAKGSARRSRLSRLSRLSTPHQLPAEVVDEDVVKAEDVAAVRVEDVAVDEAVVVEVQRMPTSTSTTSGLSQLSRRVWKSKALLRTVGDSALGQPLSCNRLSIPLPTYRIARTF